MRLVHVDNVHQVRGQVHSLDHPPLEIRLRKPKKDQTHLGDEDQGRGDREVHVQVGRLPDYVQE